MYIDSSCFKDSDENEFDNKELNQTKLVKDNLTRKEKKAKHTIRWKRKLDKFKVPHHEKVVSRRRKPKKISRKANRYNYPKVYAKSEAIFNKWFKENIYRLNYKLIPCGGNAYRFEGVRKEIKLIVSLHTAPEAEFAFTYYGNDTDERVDKVREGLCFDLSFIEYIGNEAYHPQKGYFDLDRTNEKYTYFPTREELYSEEVFEKIITDCNKKLVAENSLYMFDYGGMTFAFIDKTDESQVKKYISGIESVEGLSSQEYTILMQERKVYKVIKYDLFDLDSEPSIRYIRRKQ